MTDLDAGLARSRRLFVEFTAMCRSSESTYSLTPAAEPSAYARCFGVFCRHLANEPFVHSERATLAAAIRESARHAHAQRDTDRRGKPFRQLLAFSLSALAALGSLTDDPLEDIVREQITERVRADLDAYGALEGRPGSGNQAMFMAVLLLHARDYLNCNSDGRVQEWVALHLARMNRFGFWGSDRGMTHLQFQNGYHQYEILDFLGIASPRRRESLAAVSSLADTEGHFAQYPGGGGCYDYDAVFVLTPDGRLADPETAALLERTAITLLNEQLPNGGFAESLQVRPRQLASIGRMLSHVVDGGRALPLLGERLRYAVALQRPHHNRIHTHWSRYSRRWDESDLWDSWFRMMTLARIQIALDPSKASMWRFINYPGIGYHPCVRSASWSA